MEDTAFYFYMFDEDTATIVRVQVNELDLNPQELEFYYHDHVRKVWHKQEEEWYFSVVDVCQVLTDSAVPRRYWSDLIVKLHNEGNETYANIENTLRKKDSIVSNLICGSSIRMHWHFTKQ